MVVKFESENIPKVKRCFQLVEMIGKFKTIFSEGTSAFSSCLQAIQNPGDLALQEKAWNAVCPLVAKLKRFYEFSLRLGERRYSMRSG